MEQNKIEGVVNNMGVGVEKEVGVQEEVAGVVNVLDGVVYDGVLFKLVTHPRADEGKYYVSEDSRVYSAKRGVILKPQSGQGDYKHHMLLSDDDGVYRTKVYVHHLVAHAFLGERPRMFNSDGEEVNVVIHHKDDNMYNNKLSNLEYITHQENVQLGKVTKLSDEVVRVLRDANLEGSIDYELISKVLDVKPTTLKNAISKRTWTNVI